MSITSLIVLKQKIADNYGWERFRSLVEGYGVEPAFKIIEKNPFNIEGCNELLVKPYLGNFALLTGLAYRHVKILQESDAQFYWIFSLDGTNYRVDGISLNFGDLPTITDPKEFYPVIRIDKSYTVWQKV